jgi:hypothetical protein
VGGDVGPIFGGVGVGVAGEGVGVGDCEGDGDGDGAYEVYGQIPLDDSILENYTITPVWSSTP